LSFFSYNLTVPNAKAVFVGFFNFANLFTDAQFKSSLIKTLIFVSSTVSIELLMGLLLAVLITTNVRFISFFRTSLLIPLMMTPVVTGILWRMMFHSSKGVINYLISLLNIPSQNWLGNSIMAFVCMVCVEIWQNLPFVAFVFAAGMQSLSIDIYEAASIDGANNWQKFRFITLPLLKPVISIILLLRIMDTFKVFDVVYTLTWGGPGTATELTSILIYKSGWKYFQMGETAARSWIFLLIVFICTFYFLRNFQKQQK
jgi:multiple sugar transport system permease protein